MPISAISLFDGGPSLAEAEQQEQVSALSLFNDNDDVLDADAISPDDRLEAMLQQLDSECGLLDVAAEPQSEQHALGQRPRKTKEQIKAARQKALDENRKKRWFQKFENVPALAGPESTPDDLEGPDLNKDQLQLAKVASALWSSDVLRSATTHTALALQCQRTTLPRYLRKMVAIAFSCAETLSGMLIQKLTEVCSGQVPENAEANVSDASQGPGDRSSSSFCPQLFLRVRQYDETPLTLRIGSRELDDGSEQPTPTLPVVAGQRSQTRLFTQSCKLLATEQRWAAVFWNSEKSSHFAVEALVPTALQVIATNSAKNIATAVRESINKTYDQTVRSQFRRLVDIVATDDYSANHLAEQLLAQEAAEHTEVACLHTVCDVHKIQACAGALFSLSPGFTSGLIKAALSLRTGQIHKFRVKLKEVITDRLRVYQGPPPFHRVLA